MSLRDRGELRIDRTEESARFWRCPNGHTELEDRGDHARCIGCERQGEPARVDVVVHDRSGERVSWERVQVVG